MSRWLGPGVTDISPRDGDTRQEGNMLYTYSKESDAWVGERVPLSSAEIIAHAIGMNRMELFELVSSMLIANEHAA